MHTKQKTDNNSNSAAHLDLADSGVFAGRRPCHDQTVINTVVYIWDGVFLSATASRPMGNAMIISTFVIFLPAYYLLRPLGNHGLWPALTLLSIARGLSLSILAPRHVLTAERGIGEAINR